MWWNHFSQRLFVPERCRPGKDEIYPHEPRNQFRIATGERSGRRRILLVVIVLAVVGPLTILTTWRRAPDVSLQQADTGSPYKNTRPGVKYVGDAACSRCHAEIAETFRQHPMGRSLSPIDAAPIKGDDAGDRVLFEAQGLEYSIENRDGRVIHKETRRDASGRVIAQNEAEVQFAVGSGRLGVAYLIERDGFLFQSPIAWYPRERQWDLPPGYQTSNRPLRPSDHVRLPVLPREPGRAGTRYGQPVPAADLPGPCHRLRAVPRAWRAPRHAPHGGRRPRPDDRQPRPAGAITSGCRLRAMPLEWPVARSAGGRQDEDFRPGLPFYRFWTVLERAGGTGEESDRRPVRADAREPLLPRQRRPARVHLLPRSASSSPNPRKRRPISGIAA